MKRCLPLLLLILLTAGCAKKRNRAQLPAPPPPAPSAHKTTAKPAPAPVLAPTIDELYGYASWYGHPYHGRPTASGEIYDMNAMTAAHKTMPLGTRVGVTNEENGKQVEVRINDRGPFVEGRVIDLSYSAAKAIEMIGPGLALVRLRTLGMVEDSGSLYGVQVGVFREKKNAERLHQQLARRHTPVTLRQEGDYYRVLVGSEPTEAAAQLLAKNLRHEKLWGIVVPLR